MAVHCRLPSTAPIPLIRGLARGSRGSRGRRSNQHLQRQRKEQWAIVGKSNNHWTIRGTRTTAPAFKVLLGSHQLAGKYDQHNQDNHHSHHHRQTDCRPISHRHGIANSIADAELHPVTQAFASASSIRLPAGRRGAKPKDPTAQRSGPALSRKAGTAGKSGVGERVALASSLSLQSPQLLALIDNHTQLRMRLKPLHNQSPWQLRPARGSGGGPRLLLRAAATAPAFACGRSYSTPSQASYSASLTKPFVASSFDTKRLPRITPRSSCLPISFPAFSSRSLSSSPFPLPSLFSSSSSVHSSTTPNPSTSSFSSSSPTAPLQSRHFSKLFTLASTRRSLSQNKLASAFTSASASGSTFLGFSSVRYCSSFSSTAFANMASDRDILPGNFKPSHYDLTITDLDFKEWSFKGTVTIDGALTELTSEIVLNTLEIDITSATLEAQATKGTRSEKAAGIAYDDKSQRATLTFVESSAEAFPPSAKATLSIAFNGKLNHDLAGFYRSQYTPPAGAPPAAASTPRDDDFHYMLSTQFESCDARRAFPCFDEPNLKSTFDFAIEIPEDLVALSNMPVKEEDASATASVPAGKKLVKFERTPIMSTYLLAWAVGDFEYIEALTDRRYDGKQIPVRVYTTRGLKEQGRWALDHAPKYIDFFSERFGIDYPLPKSDILAAHEFTHGAMENWGLVTYRTTAILFDEQLSEGRFRNRIAYVVAHELAHQWFGNLVTMDWWDELWLNEGFATWAGWLATEALHPDWDVWAQFVNEGMERALKLDSLRASHPIQVPVRDALDVNQVFDAISYLKGCSVIRMLANHLGTDVFLQGVSAYLKKHKYGNAKTTALWDALSEASGQDVNTLMKSWIEKIGFPVVAVTEKENGQLTIKQSRFLSTGDVMPEDDETTWWIPLALTGRVGSAEGSVESLALTKKEDVIVNVNEDFYKLNTDSTGFYRVNYPPERLAKLGTQLDRLSASDKILIAGSAAELAFAGYTTTPALLSFLEGFGSENHVRVLSQALDAIGVISSVFGDDETINKGLKAFTLKLIEKPLAEFSLEFPENEDFSKAQLRKRLLTAAIRNGHPSLNKEALERFDAYIADPAKNPLQGDLRTPVFLAAIINDTPKTAGLLLNEWKTTVAPDGKEVALIALGATDNEEVVQNSLLPFLFGDGANTVVGADTHILASGLAHRTHARPLLWKFVQKEWTGAIERKLAGNPILLDRFIKVSLSQFSDTASLQEIEAFFADKNTKAFDRTLETVKDTIRGRAAYRTRDSEELKKWLVAHGYST